MTMSHDSPDDDIQYLIVNCLRSTDIQRFTRTLVSNQRDRMVLGESNHLQNAIKSRIQGIVTNNSTIASSEAEIVRLLVGDLVDELREGSTSTILAAHWTSFLLVTAKEFASLNRNRPYARNISFADFEGYCLGSIVNPVTFINSFFKRFKDYKTKEANLLTRLKKYAAGIIRNVVKARMAKESGDDTPGRTNIGLSIRYGRTLTKLALERNGIDPVDVDRYLDLRQSVMGYLEKKRKEEHLIPESQLSKEDRIRIDTLKPDDLNEISRLYQVNGGTSSPPILETLEIIGAAVRYHRQNPLPPEAAAVGSGIDDEIIIMCARSCVYWLSDKNGKLKPCDKEILYLKYHYHCQLTQPEIAPIFNLTQGNISRPLSRIKAGISTHFLEVLSQYMTDNPSAINTEINISSLEARKSVHTVMKEWFDRFEISQTVNSESRSNLESLIPEYKQYFAYMEVSRKKYPELCSYLAGIKKYSQRLEYLSRLNEEDYPGLSQQARSLEMLIEDIGNILKRLWN
jgi:hypothetical protein